MLKRRSRIIKSLLVSMRPHQWGKNLVVFAGLVFSRNLFSLILFIKAALAFFLFCLLSGSVYLINDTIDRGEDRKHPQKYLRPIAKGDLNRAVALAAAILIAAVTFTVSFYLDFSFALAAIVYFLLMNLYSLVLQRFVIIDIIIISAGFVLRAIAGAAVVSVKLSSWLLICTLLLALFLIICKRRQELIVVKDKITAARGSLKSYSLRSLDQMAVAAATATIITYIFYTILPETVKESHLANLKYTIPFVIYGIFRYLYLVYRKEICTSPEIILLRDKPLMINIWLWVSAVISIIYFLP